MANCSLIGGHFCFVGVELVIELDGHFVVYIELETVGWWALGG
jgi:hypothetical protein